MATSNIETTIEKQVQSAIEAGVSRENLAFGYGRVSTRKEQQAGSKEDQIQEIKTYAKEKDLHIVHIFDESASAHKPGREQFNHMLDLADDTGIPNIIFKDSSRVHRNLQDRVQVSDMMSKGIIRVHYYLTREVATRDSDPFIEDLNAILHKKFSDDLSRRISRAHRNKATNRQTAINLPIGYKWQPDTKSWAIDSEYEDTVRYIFHLYDNETHTLQEIADLCTARGFRHTSGNVFRPTTIHRILHDKCYAGYFKFKDEYLPGNHEPYITEQVWSDRQDRMAKRNNGHRRGRVEYLLAKFLRCPKCGKMYTGQINSNGSIYYYHKCPDKGDLREIIKESDILESINEKMKLLGYSEAYTKMLKDIFKKSTTHKDSLIRSEREDINREIKALTTKQSRLMDLYLDGEFQKEVLNQKNQEIQSSLDTLHKRLSDLSVDMSAHYDDVLLIIDYLREFGIEYARSDNKDRIELLRSVALGIHTDGVKVEVDWKYSFKHLLAGGITEIIPPSTNKTAELYPLWHAREDSNL